MKFFKFNEIPVKDSILGFDSFKLKCKTEYEVYSNGTKKIIHRIIFIDTKKWEDISSEKMRTDIIAHEYGHCAWDLEHLNSTGEMMSEVVSDIGESSWYYFVKQIMNSGN